MQHASPYDTHPAKTEILAALRRRLAALTAPACAMAHEAIPLDADGKPKRSAQNQSGYARSGICAEGKRAAHIGCTHTMARYLLIAAVARLPADAAAVADDVRALENDISLLDHRRFAAECRRADALLSGSHDALAAANAEIAVTVAEHRACAVRAIALRDEILRWLDSVLEHDRPSLHADDAHHPP